MTYLIFTVKKYSIQKESLVSNQRLFFNQIEVVMKVVFCSPYRGDVDDNTRKGAELS